MLLLLVIGRTRIILDRERGSCGFFRGGLRGFFWFVYITSFRIWALRILRQISFQHWWGILGNIHIVRLLGRVGGAWTVIRWSGEVRGWPALYLTVNQWHCGGRIFWGIHFSFGWKVCRAPGVEQTGIYILQPYPKKGCEVSGSGLLGCVRYFRIDSTFHVHTALAAVGETSSELCLKGRVDN